MEDRPNVRRTTDDESNLAGLAVAFPADALGVEVEPHILRHVDDIRLAEVDGVAFGHQALCLAREHLAVAHHCAVLVLRRRAGVAVAAMLCGAFRQSVPRLRGEAAPIRRNAPRRRRAGVICVTVPVSRKTTSAMSYSQDDNRCF